MGEAIKRELWEWTKALAFAIILAWVLRTVVIQTYLVDGPSMEPTLHHSERLLLNRLGYFLHPPRRGDVVVIELPNEGISIVKRIIGLPGEIIEISNGKVFIDQAPLEEPYLTQPTLANYGPIQVPDGHYFVMGDNRQNSRDSRSITIGFVAREQIKGQATLVYWPLRSLRWIRR
ncbi:MAG: signal peptidase I [Firmicutes bacterium]|nr:signal peptidase I [Bacillota bacterium]